jgi:hypothetical protein
VGATASFNPPTVTPGSAGAQSVLTIQLATQAAMTPVGEAPLRRRGFPSALFSLAISLTTVLFGAGFGRKRLPRAFVLACMLIGAGVATSLFTACGAGASATKTPPAQTENNYTITVIGMSGSFQASTTVTLVVQ